jgi:hypothetical protein
MPDLRPEEQVVAATIARTLGVDVGQHDDGSEPGMHDLEFCAEDGARAAVEVTAAADAECIELWKLVNGSDERWTIPDLRGGWFLQLSPRARAKRLRRELPSLLRDAERLGVRELPRSAPRRVMPESVGSRAQALGIVSGGQSETDFPGSVYATIQQPRERTGGLVDRTGSAVPIWTSAFLRDDHQHDVLAKLARSGAAQRHVVILLPGFTTAPFGVVDALWGESDDAVPADAPALTPSVTHVWLMTFWSVGSGLRWSPEGGWQRFERMFEDEGSSVEPS